MQVLASHQAEHALPAAAEAFEAAGKIVTLSVSKKAVPASDRDPLASPNDGNGPPTDLAVSLLDEFQRARFREARRLKRAETLEHEIRVARAQNEALRSALQTAQCNAEAQSSALKDALNDVETSSLILKTAQCAAETQHLALQDALFDVRSKVYSLTRALDSAEIRNSTLQAELQTATNQWYYKFYRSSMRLLRI